MEPLFEAVLALCLKPAPSTFLLTFIDVYHAQCTGQSMDQIEQFWDVGHDVDGDNDHIKEKDDAQALSKQQQLMLSAKVYAIALKHNMTVLAVQAYQVYVETSLEHTHIEDIIPVIPVIFHVSPDYQSLLHAHLRKWFTTNVVRLYHTPGFADAINSIDELAGAIDMAVPMLNRRHRMLCCCQNEITMPELGPLISIPA